MPQVPTARGIKIRSASDAHLLFYAVHLQRLPIIQRRLDATERMEVTSGAVFVWEERSASASSGTKMEPDGTPAIGVISGIERWTDGLKWGPSRVRDDFLFYQEKDPEQSVSPPPSHNHLYRKRTGQSESLIKQTYSVHYYPQILDGKQPTEPARKWHLTAYQSSLSAERLADVNSVPELHGITPPEGLFRKARIGKKRDAPGQSVSVSAGAAPMDGQGYPLESYTPGHGHGHNGMGHTHGQSQSDGRHSTASYGTYDRSNSVTSTTGGGPWRDSSVSTAGEIGVPHRPLLPQHPSQHGLSQDGYSSGTSGYPPSGHEHPPPGEYHPSSYPSQSHFPGTNGHGHGHSGYGEPHSPYAHAHAHPGHAHGGSYGSGQAGYSYPDGRIAYSRPPEGGYSSQPAGAHDSPSPAHMVPASVQQNSMHHGQPYHHHPPPSTNGQNGYGSYNSAPLQQSPHHHAAPIPPPPQVRHPHHSYTFSNGQPIGEPPQHPHQSTPHMQQQPHVRAESHPYQEPPQQQQQRPIMPHHHPHSQVAPLEHRRTFSQSSGVLEEMRTPPLGVARIRKGARKSEDSTAARQMMSRSPPSGHQINGAATAGVARPVGADGGRATQYSPYTRPANAPGPRQHPAMAPHHQNESSGPPLSSYDGSYTPRANGSFSQQGSQSTHGDSSSLHIRPPSTSHPFATPSVPSIPAPPDSHQYAAPPPLPRADMPQSSTGYYLPQNASRNEPYPPFGQPDYSRSQQPAAAGPWTQVTPTEASSGSRPTSLQTHSAFPPPAGSFSHLQQTASHSHSHGNSNGVEPSKEVFAGIPAVPIGTTFPGYMTPHLNPNSSPILTQFQPMSTSVGSSRSGSGASGSVSGGVGPNGSPPGLHHHMGTASGGMSNMWDGSDITARGATPAAPPRIDTSIGGVNINSSPVSVSATAAGSASGSVSSKLGPLTPSTNLVTRDPEDERVLDLLSRGLAGTASKAAEGVATSLEGETAKAGE